MDKKDIFTVSRYFKTRDDFRNIELVCKKYRDFALMFRYNPISDTDLFPMMKRQYFYKREDVKNKIDGMSLYVYCFEVNQYEWIFKKDNEKYLSVTLKNMGIKDKQMYTDIDGEKYFIDNNYESIDSEEERDSCKKPWNCPLPIVNGVVDVPEGITKINDFCFSGCVGITKINLPSTLKEIGSHAFEGTSIKEIKIPEGVTKIKGSCFKECYGIESVIFPKTVREIGPWCIFMCNRLKSVTIPKECKVGKEAFHDVSKVEYYK